MVRGKGNDGNHPFTTDKTSTTFISPSPSFSSFKDIMSTNFSPTPAELTLVSQIFAQADPQKLGVLTGDVAVRVFSGAKLPPASLGEIWNIADSDNNGWLSKKGVAMAVRLIGWAQKGEAITAALLNKRNALFIYNTQILFIFIDSNYIFFILLFFSWTIGCHRRCFCCFTAKHRVIVPTIPPTGVLPSSDSTG